MWILHHSDWLCPGNVDLYLLKNEIWDKDAKLRHCHPFWTVVQPQCPQVGVKAKANLQQKCQTTLPVTSANCGISKSLSDPKRNVKQDIKQAIILLLAVHVVFQILARNPKEHTNDSVYICSSYLRLFCYLYLINPAQAPVKAIHKCQPEGKRQWSGLQKACLLFISKFNPEPFPSSQEHHS